MSDPIRILLSEHQQRYFASLRAQEAEIQRMRNVYASAIIAGEMDPATLDGCGIDCDGEAIVISARPEPTNRIAALNGAKKRGNPVEG